MNTHRFTHRAILRGKGVTMALPWLESFNVWGSCAPGITNWGEWRPVPLGEA
ncbi:MAG: hypothetical protein WCI46_05985 [Verrucomicrobiota bacterium]